MLRSPSTNTTTTSPCFGVRLRSTMSRSPSKMPASLMQSPATLNRKVAGRLRDEVAVQVDLALDVVVCRAWEACAQRHAG